MNSALHPRPHNARLGLWLGILGGALRVSQPQRLQPFVSILAALPILGKTLDLVTLGFAGAEVGTVFLGKNLATSPVPMSAK